MRNTVDTPARAGSLEQRVAEELRIPTPDEGDQPRASMVEFGAATYTKMLSKEYV